MSGILVRECRFFLLYLRYFCLFVNEIGDFCVPLRSLPLL